MKEVGKVIKKTGNLAVVEIKESSACAKCHAYLPVRQAGRQAGGICAFDKSGTLTLEAIDIAGASVGDYVEAEIPGRDILLSGFLIFILPIVVFFSGYILIGAIFGAVLLAIYLTMLYLYDRSRKTIPRITRVLSNR